MEVAEQLPKENDGKMFVFMGKPRENHRKMVVLWDLMAIYPLVIYVTVCDIENGPVKIVSLRSKNGVCL